MRIIAIAMCLLVASEAFAQSAKQVEIINQPVAVTLPEPLQVEVVSAPPAPEVVAVEVLNLPDVQVVELAEAQDLQVNVTCRTASTVQAVGVTTQLFTGDLGGWQGLIRACDEFPGTRMCTLDEIRQSFGPIPSFPEDGAWVDGGSTGDTNCLGWRHSTTTGRAILDNGNTSNLSCSVPRPVTCCGLR